jgi:hypothetical protein
MSRKLVLALSVVVTIQTATLGESLRDEANALAAKSGANGIYLGGELTLPYHERLSFTVLRPGSNNLTGHFSKDYLSSTQWRERYDLGDYVRIRVRNGQQQGDFRSAAYEPTIFAQLREAIPPVFVAFSNVDSVKKIDDQSIHGVKARCVQYENPTHGSSYQGEVCFDGATQMLLSWRRQTTGIVCITMCSVRETEWFDYSPYRERLYPRRFIMKLRGKPIIEVSVEFTPGDDLKPPAFSIPQGFEISKPCNHTSAPVRIEGDLPPFPHRINEFEFEGTVLIQARIGVDGRVQDAQIARSPYSSTPSTSFFRGRRDVDSVLEDAVKKWQFEPARCDGAPMVDNVVFPVTVEVR